MKIPDIVKNDFRSWYWIWNTSEIGIDTEHTPYIDFWELPFEMQVGVFIAYLKTHDIYITYHTQKKWWWVEQKEDATTEIPDQISALEKAFEIISKTLEE